jgi:hypothetical protein
MPSPPTAIATQRAIWTAIAGRRPIWTAIATQRAIRTAIAVQASCAALLAGGLAPSSAMASSVPFLNPLTFEILAQGYTPARKRG